MAIFFAVSLFVSSTLLFLVQPMCAKMVLPLLGGTPGVWNTCMVFFQAGLLAGYAYAHAGPKRLGTRGHALMHISLFVLALWFLPIDLAGREPPAATFPFYWLVGVLLLAAGFPYVMVAASAPLLQKWFAATGTRRAQDPYFLYAASNFGSMLALFSYPLLVEPNFALSEQSRLWTAGYGVLGIFTAGCALLRAARDEGRGAREGSPLTPRPSSLASHHSPLAPRPSSLAPRLRWLVLALVPSSLMLSVTTYLTVDIAAIPLFWVVPLAIYLLTFILVFAGKPVLPHAVFVRWMPLVVLILVLVRLTEATEPILVLLGLHLLGLFWIAMVCHGELARTRPSAEHLTEYYLWLALGGVLGGLFNALVAPLVFTTILEYPLMLVLACLLLPGREGRVARDEGRAKKGRPIPLAPRASPFGPHPAALLDVVLPALVGGATVALILFARHLRLEPGPVSVAVIFALPTLICYTFMDRPLRLGLGLGAVLLASGLYPGVYGQAEYRVRSFFGVHRVTHNADRSYRFLIHGNTKHGVQSLDPDRQTQPLSYYYRDPEGSRSSPIGQLFETMKGDVRLDRVGLIGLGAGALACYADTGQDWTFYEIDPSVIDIARERFTYLRHCRGRLAIETGDGRLSLAHSQQRFGVIVVDAFSSDSIPVHLLTREALAVYRARLHPGGVLAFHISNRYLNLEPVLANLASAARPPLSCWIQKDLVLTLHDQKDGKAPSIWVVLAESPDDLKQLLHKGPWTRAHEDPRMRVWTDDFSNLFDVLELTGENP